MYITQALKRAVQVNGDGIATIDGKRRHTWAEFVDRVARLAGALLELGLEPEDRIAMWAANSDRHLEYYFASIWAGGIFVPLNTRLAPPEVAGILQDATPKFLIVDEALEGELPAVLTHADPPAHTIFAGEGKSENEFPEHETLIEASSPAADANRGGDDTAAIYYTSGTTGQFKGVMLSHNNTISNAMSALAIMYDQEPWTFLHVAPMFHIADSQWNTGVTIHAGTHVFTRKFQPEEMLQLISQQQITHTALVPTMINMLCNDPKVDNYDVLSLRKVNFGGSPIAPSVIRQARELFPNCEFIQGYGQTETAPNISMLLDRYNTDEGPYAGKIESAGQAVFPMEIRIVGPEDEVLPTGEIGEITTRGPHVMRGYWKKPKETEEALRGGWMHTGDIGYLDKDGFLFVVDRARDMIISGGENVYSTEVEHVIYQHPAVAECAVIGIPDKKWGEAIHAIIIPKEGQDITDQAIIDHCRLHIAGYKCPRSIEIRREPLPKSGAGKVLKKLLREPYWSDSGREIN